MLSERVCKCSVLARKRSYPFDCTAQCSQEYGGADGVFDEAVAIWKAVGVSHSDDIHRRGRYVVFHLARCLCAALMPLREVEGADTL